MGKLALKQINKAFQKTEVLGHVDLEVEDGEFVVIVGPSGCGKSTLLRIIAGLETQTRGEVRIDGNDISHLPPSKRGIAMVFQSYALYPHLSVEGNMTLGLKRARVDKSTIRSRVAEAARILELEPYLKRRPGQLSGGQRQRVAIGRAITRHPEVFLFDEPLSNLDAALRTQVRVEIAEIHRRLGATMIYVTHDQVEAMTLADRIVVMNGGVVQQIGTPSELYRYPANLFVAGFIGSPKINMLQAQMSARTAHIPGIGEWKFDIEHEGSVTVAVRPGDLSIHEKGSNDGFVGEVQSTEYLGNVVYVRVVLCDGRIVVVEEKPTHSWKHGQKVYVTAANEQVHLFDEDGKRLSATK